MASVEVYDFSKFIAMMVYIKKTTPDLSIVKRLGGAILCRGSAND